MTTPQSPPTYLSGPRVFLGCSSAISEAVPGFGAAPRPPEARSAFLGWLRYELESSPRRAAQRSRVPVCGGCCSWGCAMSGPAGVGICGGCGPVGFGAEGRLIRSEGQAFVSIASRRSP